MFGNINEILLTLTVVLAVAAVGIRILLKVNRLEWLKRFMTWVLEYVDVGLSAILIALFIRAFIVEPFRIPSSSMEDTLLIGDHLFVNRFIYGLRIPLMKKRPLSVREPRRGDIVVFIPPHQRDKDFIKRVIGTPGDKVEIRDQDVFVNGRKLDEPYVVHKDARFMSRLRRNQGQHGPRSRFRPASISCWAITATGARIPGTGGSLPPPTSRARP